MTATMPTQTLAHHCIDHLRHHTKDCVETHGLDCGPYETWTEEWDECSVCDEKFDDHDVIHMLKEAEERAEHEQYEDDGPDYMTAYKESINGCQALTHQETSSAIERVLIGGDLKDLKTEERVSYYSRVCESLGLNPLTQPFAYLSLSGKLTLYARKDAAEQLRSVRNISLRILSREIIDGMYVVTCEASTPSGRTDTSTGVIDCAKLSGEASKANAMMKAETKAKRRVTLSICGLGLMDETEVDSVAGARKVSVEDAHSGRLLAAPKETGQGKQTHTRDAEPGTGTGAAEKPAAPAEPKLDPRPIPEELREAVAKMRLGDLDIVRIVDTMFKREFMEACGSEDLYTAETTAFRQHYPKGEKWPYEAMVSMWLDCWAILESCKFANSANPETV